MLPRRFAFRIVCCAVPLSVIGVCTGCSGKGVGETVASPPREQVEKSFRPPTAGGRPTPKPSIAPTGNAGVGSR
jgi:hypothetical protein